jgi:uncharacterized iron-regulated membrane protein
VTGSATSYRTFWRWHFYAGLFVLPFVLVLSFTGSIYLFKPQIDRWEERDFRDLGTAGAVSPDAQAAAVLAQFPRGRFVHYRLPEREGDAPMIELDLPGERQRDVYVSPQGRVLGSLDPEQRPTAVLSRLHGSLLLGRWGDWLVELAASWTIVMILTGLYLWWPRPFAFAGTVWPRTALRGRPLLKDVHRVTGFWISGFVLVMLASGLPWAGAWGTAFAWVREEMGLVQGPQDWKIGASPEHVHGPGASPMSASAMTPSAMQTALPAGLPLSAFVSKATAEGMAFPVIVIAPHSPQRFGPLTGDEWTAKSEAQNRTLARSVSWDPSSGTEIARSGFADKHVIDRVVNYGIAWHEGQLFGWINQLAGVVVALALMAISVLGVTMWWKRRPQGTLGAPVAPPTARPAAPLMAGILVLAVVLPLFGASLVAILLLETLLLRRHARTARWLGLRARS